MSDKNEKIVKLAYMDISEENNIMLGDPLHTRAGFERQSAVSTAQGAPTTGGAPRPRGASKLNNYLALTRTYMASIRTNAIFIGLSIALMKVHSNTGFFLLLFSLLLSLSMSYYFFMTASSLQDNFFKTRQEKHMYFTSPLLFGLFICVTQIMFLIGVLRHKNKIDLF